MNGKRQKHRAMEQSVLEDLLLRERLVGVFLNNQEIAAVASCAKAFRHIANTISQITIQKTHIRQCLLDLLTTGKIHGLRTLRWHCANHYPILAATLETHPWIQRVEILHAKSQYLDVARCLQNLTDLRYLCLREATLSDGFACSLLALTSLRRIDIGVVNATVEQTNCLLSSLQSLHNLSSLALRGLPFRKEFVAGPRYKFILFERCSFTIDACAGLSSSLRGTQCLKNLQFVDCAFDSGAISRLFNTVYAPTRYLQLRGCVLDIPEFKRLFWAFPDLQTLDISHNFITLGEMRQALDNECMPKLRSLFMDYNLTSTQDVKYLVDILRRAAPNLQMLSAWGAGSIKRAGHHTERVPFPENSRRILSVFGVSYEL
jgi:hypothetical protein